MMQTIAKLASPLNWPPGALGPRGLPRLYAFGDDQRLSSEDDMVKTMNRMPRGACFILRHTDRNRLRDLASCIVPAAHRRGLLVLLAGHVRDALAWGCDGVHLSQQTARRGPIRLSKTALPRGFVITAAAHDRPSIFRAARAGAHLAFLSPVFLSESHPERPAIGPIRFRQLTWEAPVCVAALGGITPATAKRLSRIGRRPYGLAAIGGWNE